MADLQVETETDRERLELFEEAVVGFEAAEFLEKVQGDEPSKLASRLQAICKHLQQTGKEDSKKIVVKKEIDERSLDQSDLARYRSQDSYDLWSPQRPDLFLNSYDLWSPQWPDLSLKTRLQHAGQIDMEWCLEALGGIPALDQEFFSIPRTVSKRKLSNVEGSIERLANKIQLRDTPYAAVAVQVEPNSEGVCDCKNRNVFTSLPVSPLRKPQAQPVDENLYTQIVTVDETGIGTLYKEQPDAFQHSETGLFNKNALPVPLTRGNHANVLQLAEQAIEGIQSGQGLEINVLSKSGEFRRDQDLNFSQVEQPNVSREMVNYPSSCSTNILTGIFRAHSHGDTIAHQAKHLRTVSLQNSMCILKEAHKSFLQEEGLDRFASLNWHLQDFEETDLHELIRSYDDIKLTSQWNNLVIDLGDDALSKIFSLSRSSKEPLLKATKFRSNFFPIDAERRNGFLLSKCNNPSIKERLKFLWEALHLKTVTPEIPYYIVKLLEEPVQKKNWSGYFLQGFREELKRGQKGKASHLGSHLRLVLAAQATLATKVEATSSGKKQTDSKATFPKLNDNNIGLNVKDEGETLQVDGQALGAEDLTQGNDVKKGIPLIPLCVSWGYSSPSTNDLETAMTTVGKSLEAMEKDVKATMSQTLQKLENEKKSLSNENDKLRAEKKNLVAAHQREKEELLEEFRQKEKQLEEHYDVLSTQNKVKISSAIEMQMEWMSTQNKVKISSAIERQMEWMAELEKIQEAKKKDVEGLQSLLKQHEKVDEKLAMVEYLFNQVKEKEAQLEFDYDEIDIGLEAHRVRLEAHFRKERKQLKLMLNANKAAEHRMVEHITCSLRTASIPFSLPNKDF